MANVLVTGSAGAVGRAVCRELLARGHRVRGLDRAPTPGLDDVVVADIADIADGGADADTDAFGGAFRDVDSVVHLAAEPDDTAFAKLARANVTGLHNVMAAAREHGVARVVLASTMQVAWSGREPDRFSRAREARPMNHYALTKLWAEQMGEMYARCFDMSVVAIRLVWMVRNPGEARQMAARPRPTIYVSQRDAGRAFACAVEAHGISFAVVYVAGPDGAQVFDLEPARRLIGFTPRDRWPEGLEFDF